MARPGYDKKVVTCYLDSTLENQVREYCTNNGLIRKAKDKEDNETIEPRWGSGIVAILEEYFNNQVQDTVQTETSDEQKSDSTVQNEDYSTNTVQSETTFNEELETLKDSIAELQERLRLVEDKQKSNQDVIASLDETKLSRGDFEGWSHPIHFETCEPDNRESEGKIVEDQSTMGRFESADNHQDARDDSFNKIYTTVDLANRFGINPKYFPEQLKKAWDNNDGIYLRDRGPHKGEKWKIVGRYPNKPYELRRIE